VNDAAVAAKPALALSLEHRERGWPAWTLRLQGDIAATLDRPDYGSAAESYQRALELADELGMRPLVAHCHLGLGGLHRLAEPRPRALEHYATATAMFAEMGMSWWRDHAEREGNR
jgi:hypothetical protein